MRAPGVGRGKLRPLSVVLLLILTIAPLAEPKAQNAGGDGLYAVQGVAAGDVLNMRDAPNGDEILGHIPPSARGITALGPRARSQGGNWAQVRYGAISGWVNMRFLTPDRLATASSAAPSAAIGAMGSGAARRGRLFDGVWHHARWNLTIDAEQLAFLPAPDGTQPARVLALGSRECGVVYERNFAAVDIDDIPAVFTDPRFRTWARASTQGRTVAVMIVTCGSLSHRFFVFLTDRHKMLVAEWDEKGWLMYEEFSSGSRQVGRQ